jgi:hypothetical protein
VSYFRTVRSYSAYLASLGVNIGAMQELVPITARTMRFVLAIALVLPACGGNTTLLVSEEASAQTSAVVAFPLGMVGVSYRYPRAGEPQLGEDLTGVRHFTFTALPDGLVGDESAGTISGVPKTAGAFSVVIKMTTSEGESGEWLGSGEILGRFTVSGFALPDAFVGMPLRYKPALNGGKAPYSISYEGLPPGVSFDPQTGALIGAPSEEGDFVVTRSCREAYGINDGQRTVLRVFPASEARASVRVAFCTASDDATRPVTARPDALEFGAAKSLVDCVSPQAYSLRTFAELLDADATSPHVDFVVTDPTEAGKVSASFRVNGVERAQPVLVESGGIYSLILSKQSLGIDFATLRETDSLELRVTADTTLGRAYGAQQFQLRFLSAPASIADLDLSSLPPEEAAAGALSYQDASLERVFSVFAPQPRSGAYPFVGRTITNVSRRPLQITITRDNAAMAHVERETSTATATRNWIGALTADNPQVQAFYPMLHADKCVPGNVVAQIDNRFGLNAGSATATRGVCLPRAELGFVSETVLLYGTTAATMSRLLPSLDAPGGSYKSGLRLDDFALWTSSGVVREAVSQLTLAPGETVSAVLGFNPQALANDPASVRVYPRKEFIVGGVSYFQYAAAQDPVENFGTLSIFEGGVLAIATAFATFERAFAAQAKASPLLSVKAASGEVIDQSEAMHLQREVMLLNQLEPAFTQFGLRYHLNPPF